MKLFSVNETSTNQIHIEGGSVDFLKALHNHLIGVEGLELELLFQDPYLGVEFNPIRYTPKCIAKYLIELMTNSGFSIIKGNFTSTNYSGLDADFEQLAPSIVEEWRLGDRLIEVEFEEPHDGGFEIVAPVFEFPQSDIRLERNCLGYFSVNFVGDYSKEFLERVYETMLENECDLDDLSEYSMQKIFLYANDEDELLGLIKNLGLFLVCNAYTLKTVQIEEDFGYDLSKINYAATKVGGLKPGEEMQITFSLV